MTAAEATKAVFLDVDGVLHAATARHRPFRAPCMDILKTILHEGGAQIVLSSNWRLDAWGIDMLNAKLQQNGIDPVIDTTCLEEDFWNTRADEVLDCALRTRTLTAAHRQASR